MKTINGHFSYVRTSNTTYIIHMVKICVTLVTVLTKIALPVKSPLTLPIDTYMIDMVTVLLLWQQHYHENNANVWPSTLIDILYVP